MHFLVNLALAKTLLSHFSQTQFFSLSDYVSYLMRSLILHHSSGDRSNKNKVAFDMSLYKLIVLYTVYTEHYHHIVCLKVISNERLCEVLLSENGGGEGEGVVKT